MSYWYEPKFMTNVNSFLLMTTPIPPSKQNNDYKSLYQEKIRALLLDFQKIYGSDALVEHIEESDVSDQVDFTDIYSDPDNLQLTMQQVTSNFEPKLSTLATAIRHFVDKEAGSLEELQRIDKALAAGSDPMEEPKETQGNLALTVSLANLTDLFGRI